MITSSRMPEGWPNNCPICGHELRIELPSNSLDASCPNCGHRLWIFAGSGHVAPIYDAAQASPEFDPVDLDEDVYVSEFIIDLIPKSVARENRVLPIAATGGALVLAIAVPCDMETVEKLRFILNRDIYLIPVTEQWLSDQFRKRYGDDTPKPE